MEYIVHGSKNQNDYSYFVASLLKRWATFRSASTNSLQSKFKTTISFYVVQKCKFQKNMFLDALIVWIRWGGDISFSQLWCVDINSGRKQNMRNLCFSHIIVLEADSADSVDK